MKANDHLNYWKFQLHWNNLEWVYPEKWNCKDNSFCPLTHKFYIKYGKQKCHFFGHSKLKPIDYVAFFNIQEHSSALTASISSIKVAQTREIFPTTSSKSVKNTSQEASGQIASVNEPQGNKYYSDEVSIEQASLSFKKYIELIDKDDGKTQWRIIYEAIDYIFFENLITLHQIL